MNQSESLPVLPMEIWTNEIIPIIFERRINDIGDERYMFSECGHLKDRTTMGAYPSSFTLTALKRTCKILHKAIKPYCYSAVYNNLC